MKQGPSVILAPLSLFDSPATRLQLSALYSATSTWNLTCTTACMADGSKLRILGDTPKEVSRRRFIKGVIAGGAAVSSASYLFRSSAVHGAVGSGARLITLNVNGQQRRV